MTEQEQPGVSEGREDLAIALIRHRKAVLSYIFSIVRNHHTAEDVFQEVSVVLIRRAHEFGEVKNFWGLAKEIARRQALSALRRSKKDTPLSEVSLEALDRGFDIVAEEAVPRELALRSCVASLPVGWRQLVQLRYWQNLSVIDLAKKLGKSVNNISVTLNRIRSRLADCVNQRVQKEVLQ